MSNTRNTKRKTRPESPILTETSKKEKPTKKAKKKVISVSPSPLSEPIEAIEISETKEFILDETIEASIDEIIEKPIETIKTKNRKSKKIAIESDDDAPLSPELASLFPVAAPGEERDFGSEDFVGLSANEYYRYLNNSNKVGHAVISKDENGNEIAFQYKLPTIEDGSAPEVRPLVNIQVVDPKDTYGLHRYRASTPDNNTVMYATRYIDTEFSEGNTTENFQIACFSPKKGRIFWGAKDKDMPVFRDDLTQEVKKDLIKELKEIKEEDKTKCGNELIIDPDSVRERDKIKVRKPDQNTVMEQSAKDAYEDFLEQFRDELHPEMIERMERAINAPLRDMFYGNYRPEWLHGEGFSLTPMNINPQRKNNLGSAPKWANTEMMVLERIAKWFALNRPHSIQKIKPYFEMLLGSDLIHKINFEVTIEENNRSIKFPQTLYPFAKHHLFRKASDLAQVTGIAERMLKGIPPIDQQTIKDSKPSKETEVKEFKQEITKEGKTMRSSRSKKIIEAKQDDIGKKKTSLLSTTKTIKPNEMTASSKETKNFPTKLNSEKSIVQIATTFQIYNYDNPPSTTETWNCWGSGLVIEHENKKYILTNAHCVENHVVVRVRLANTQDEYEATPKLVSYQCDLALLEVDDPEFLEKVEPVELGEMVHLEQRVQTIGFPMGGDEICIADGIVSRIEVGEYAMSDMNCQEMLQVQVSAPINHGNSGGPVFSGPYVVGVAFQGLDRAQNVGYMIPIPIIKHFLNEALNRDVYHGFPILPVTFQVLENPNLRKYYNMKEGQTGVRVRKLDYLSDAHDKLQVDDIVLEIDGYKISNQGTVDVENIGKNINMIHITHMKYIGDTVNLKVLRKNKLTQKSEILDIEVILDNVPRQSEKIFTEHDKMPTYFISSGISFVPATSNFLEGQGGDLDECFLIEEGCYLKDLPKKNPTDQIVVINDILNCKETKGYGDYVNNLVKEINGKPINNIRDVIDAMENFKGDVHLITTTSKTVIAVPNMTKERHEELLRKYHISKDRSLDLLAPEKPQLKTINESKNETTKNKSSSSIFNLLTSANKNTNKPVKKKITDVVSESELSDAESVSPVEDILDKFKNKPMPGQARYQQKLDEMEQFYKDHPEEDDDEDYAIDMNDDDDESASLASESSVEEVRSKKSSSLSLTKAPQRYSTFHREVEKRKHEDENNNRKRHKVGR